MVAYINVLVGVFRHLLLETGKPQGFALEINGNAGWRKSQLAIQFLGFREFQLLVCAFLCVFFPEWVDG